MEIFAKRLKYEREKRKLKDSKWTQGYMADLLGVARPTYTAYENGTKQPPIETINKIADYFDVKVDYLLGRIEKNNVTNNHETFDSLTAITDLAKKHGLDQLGFFDIEEWKNLSPEEIKMLDAQFKAVAKMAKERNEEK
jgi:transcriptional regulator with XRE-family HTH domain